MLEFKKEENEALKLKVEAVLFSSGKKVTLEELTRLCRANETEIKKALNYLKEEYASRNSSISLFEENNTWKLNVKEKFLPVVQNVVSETELTKAVMETLAIIAFKHPVLQSEVVKIRSNKAYEHLKELNESGFITREKYGRTRRIRLAPKFFEYFDLPPDKIREAFTDFEAVEKVIESKEIDAQKLKEALKAKKEEKEDPVAEIEVYELEKVEEEKVEEPKPLEEAKVNKKKEETKPEINTEVKEPVKTEEKEESQIEEETQIEEQPKIEKSEEIEKKQELPILPEEIEKKVQAMVNPELRHEEKTKGPELSGYEEIVKNEKQKLNKAEKKEPVETKEMVIEPE